VALHGVLGLIAQAGGGLVEAYPQGKPGKKTSASFLYNGTRSPFEWAGFSYERPVGKNHCVMRKTVPPGEQSAAAGLRCCEPAGCGAADHLGVAVGGVVALPGKLSTANP
jgi:hypothetical protein